MNTGNKPWILHNDQNCLDEIVRPPNGPRPVVFPCGFLKGNAAGERVGVLFSLQTIKQVVRVRPQWFGTCTTCTPSLSPSLPTPQRAERFVRQDETGRHGAALRCHCHCASIYLSGFGPRWRSAVPCRLSIYHSKVLFCKARGIGRGSAGVRDGRGGG